MFHVSSIRSNVEVAGHDPSDQAQSALRRYKQRYAHLAQLHCVMTHVPSRNETLRAVMNSSKKPPITAIEDGPIPPNEL